MSSSVLTDDQSFFSFLSTSLFFPFVVFSDFFSFQAELKPDRPDSLPPLLRSCQSSHVWISQEQTAGELFSLSRRHQQKVCSAGPRLVFATECEAATKPLLTFTTKRPSISTKKQKFTLIMYLQLCLCRYRFSTQESRHNISPILC